MATVLITGANRGIGLELSRQLTERGDQVIALCRKPGPDLEALGVRLFSGVDVTDRAALEAVSKDLGDANIDVLINNAGILESDTFDSLNFDQIRTHFEINTLGALLVTSVMRGQLDQGSKIIIMTSRMGSIDDNGSGGY